MPNTASHAAIRALLSRERQQLKRAFFVLLRALRRPGLVHVVCRYLIVNHDVDSALQVMDGPLRDFAEQLARSFVRAGTFEAKQHQARLRLRKAQERLAKQPPRFPFVGDEDAASIMNGMELDFIKDFSDSQRDLVRAALSTALDRGYSPLKAARSFRDAIGLTENQYQAVQSYRSMLESGSSEALNRELRDKRTDRTVAGTIERGDVLTVDQVDRMVSRYSDNMAAHRADTIALTESHRAVSLGRFTALQSISDQYDIAGDSVTRTWNTTLDGRERDSHEAMDGQEVTGFDEPYVSGNGVNLMYPGDPSAPAEETIRCRCVETYEIASPDEIPEDAQEAE